MLGCVIDQSVNDSSMRRRTPQRVQAKVTPVPKPKKTLQQSADLSQILLVLFFHGNYPGGITGETPSVKAPEGTKYTSSMYTKPA